MNVFFHHLFLLSNGTDFRHQEHRLVVMEEELVMVVMEEMEIQQEHLVKHLISNSTSSVLFAVNELLMHSLWTGAVGTAYGVLRTPTSLGSGGGHNYLGNSGGNGGGALHIVVTQDLHVFGVIDASGTNAGTASGYDGGGKIFNLHKKPV